MNLVQSASSTPTDPEVDAILFESYNARHHLAQGYDEVVRDPAITQALFDHAGISPARVPAIVVTGSKGKGSTAILTAAILSSQGRRVGLLTSPQFLSHRERIRFQGEVIPLDDYAHIIAELTPHIRAVSATLNTYRYISPTGLFLAIALRYFEQCGADALVLEAGRGGQYDDVICVPNRVAVLTQITPEHLDRLGPTTTDIARHKAGLIHPGAVAILGPMDAAARATTLAIANQRNARVFALGHAIQAKAQPGPGGTQARIALAIPDDASEHPYELFLPTLGLYQADNLALALAAVSCFEPGLIHNRAGLASRLARVRLPGRCEQIATSPTVLVDGAINGESASAFVASALPHSPGPRVAVLALPADKDHAGLLDALIPHLDALIITHASAHHLRYDDEQLLHAPIQSLFFEPDVQAAFALAHAQATTTGTIWVIGTQSLVRDALKTWENDLTHLWPA